MERATLPLGTFVAVVIVSLFGYGGCGGGGGSGGGSTPDTGTAPTISGVTPSSGYTDLDTTIQIAGTNFASGATVKIGATAASGVTIASSTSITAIVDDGLTAGASTVTVTNSDGQSATLAAGFTATAPPSEWSKETLAWSGTTKALTSTCTLITAANTYRTYFTGVGGIWTATSNDGLTWTNQTLTGVVDQGATNPAVIALANGTFLMIYGIQTAMPTTEILYRATSNDGVNFAKQGTALTASTGENNFVSVPDLVFISTTRLRMYFVAGTTASRVHTAYSDDSGATWTREGEIAIAGGPYGGQVNDPDVIKKPDGTWWLFFTTPPAGQAIGDLRLRSAVSSDGRSFTLESGSRVTPSGSVSAVMDPDCIPIVGQSGRYRVYYGGNLTPTGPDELRAIISPQ